MEVLPVINCPDLPCVLEKLERIEQFSKWVHLDVADGIFTFHKTWNNPLLWPKLKPTPSLEVHLMVEEPEKVIDAWLKAGAKRLIIHFEAIDENSAHTIVKAAKMHQVEVMLASNPETSAEKLLPYVKLFSSFQVLAVRPGLPGQKFLPLVLEKVKFLRAKMPDATIEVDGGITAETATLAKLAGANAVVSGTYLFEGSDPQAKFQELTRI